MNKQQMSLYSRIKTPADKPNCEECMSMHCNMSCPNRKIGAIKYTKEELDNMLTESQIYQIMHDVLN